MIMWFTRFRRRSGLRALPRKSCANASSGIAPKTCARLRSLSVPANVIAKRGRLFPYERLRAFPSDVWIERVLRQQYFPRRKKMTAHQLREFSETYFGEHGGYAQQYLFHHARTVRRK